MFYKKNVTSSKKAFSLVELSIVIVLIGVLIAGVVGSKHLIKKAKISSAQAITRSSPISALKNNKLWLETSLAEISLDGASATGDLITQWLDSSSNKTAISISAVGDGPVYSNSINDIQAIRFDDASITNHLQIDDASFLNGTDYTIVITEKRMAFNSGVKNYLLGEDGSFAVGYESDSSIIQTHGEDAGDDNQSNIEGSSSYINKPRVLVFTHSSVDGNKIYINATLANEDTSAEAKAHLSGLEELVIGKGYNGEIGEIAIFNRDLKSVELIDVEDYLTDKWNVANNRDSIPECINGTLLSNVCDASCVVSVNGSSATSIAAGSSLQIPCDEEGYTGTTTETYSCSMGSLDPSTPAASQCLDDNGCDSGYVVSGDECIVDTACRGLSITGSSVTEVDHGADSPINCDATGYSGTSTGYSCNNTIFTAGTDCACDTANDYVSDGGQCVLQCTIESQFGLASDTLVLPSATSINCGVGSGGTIDFVCLDGAFTTGPTNNCTCPIGYSQHEETCQTAFVSEWDTTRTSTGSSNSNQVMLPLKDWGTYDFTVDWGDGNISVIQSWNDPEVTHTYDDSGTYEIKIAGQIHGFQFLAAGDYQKIGNVSHWGPLQVGTDQGSYFARCSNLTSNATDVLDTSGITNMRAMFEQATYFNDPNAGSWDVSNVTNMYATFKKTHFNQDISGWDVSKVGDMARMFEDSRAFDQNIGAWTLKSGVRMTIFVTGNAMSTANYSAALNGWANNPDTPSGIQLEYRSTKYNSSALAARNSLTEATSSGGKGWEITDGGYAP